MGAVDRPSGGEDAYDIEVGEGHDQRKQCGNRHDVAHHRQRHEPQALPPVRAVDSGRLVELLGHRFERRQIHDHEERRADPDIDQDHRKTRPVGIPGPRHWSNAEPLEHPVQRAVGRVEQPEPGEAAHRRRNHPRHQQHAAPFALPLARHVMHEMGDDESDQRFEYDRRYGEQARLPHHHPERFTLEQEQEISQADETLHRLVERGEMDGIEGRVKDQQRDEENERQRHQKRERRFAPHRIAPAQSQGGAAGGRSQDRVDHELTSGTMTRARATRVAS